MTAPDAAPRERSRGGLAGELDLDSVSRVEPAPVADPIVIAHGATVDAVGDVVQAPSPPT